MTSWGAIAAALRPYCYRNFLFVAETGAAFADATAFTSPAYRFAFPIDPSGLSDCILRDVATSVSSLQSRCVVGDELGIVVWQGRVVHRSLVQRQGTAPMEGDRTAFKLGERESYIHSCFTSDAHRGHGLYSTMLRHILHTLSMSDPGLRVFIACRQENVASVSAIRRAGFSYVKSSLVLGIASGRVRYRRWYVDDLLQKGIPLTRREAVTPVEDK